MRATNEMTAWAVLCTVLLILVGCAAAPVEAPKAEGVMTAAAARTLAISRKASYQRESSIPEAVRAKCGLEEIVPAALKRELGDNAVLADEASASTPGRTLNLSITNVVSRAGGAFTGPKSLTVRGTLRENGKQVGSFTASRSDKYGGGACLMLRRSIDEMAGDIKKWLESPGNEDRLGEAK